MAEVSVNIHIRPEDEPLVSQLESGSLALWLGGKHRGPTLIGSPEALLEVRRAIGRFLFPEDFAQPEAEEAAQ